MDCESWYNFMLSRSKKFLPAAEYYDEVLQFLDFMCSWPRSQFPTNAWKSTKFDIFEKLNDTSIKYCYS